MSPRAWVRRGVCALAFASSARAGDERPAATEEITVEAPRTARASDPTSATTVVDADRFAGESKDVAALLATAPGVAVQEYGGLGQLATVSLRGASADGVKVLLDGLPLNTAAGGGVDLSTIPPAWVERIEVVRGAEGARYGAGALGGVVNVVTRGAVAGRWSARVSGGSFDTGSAGGDIAVGGDAWGALVAAGLDAAGGRFPYLHDDRPSLPGNPLAERVRTDNAYASGGLLAKGWTQLGRGRADALLQLSGARRGLPGPAYPERPDNEDRERESRATGAARMAIPISTGLDLSLAARGRAERLDLTLAPGGRTRQRDLAGEARAEVAWGAGPSQLEVGLSAGAERLDADGLGGPRARTELAAWASEELRLAGDRLRLAPAVRGERLGGLLGLSAKLGVSAALWGPVAVRASAGRTFRAPSFAELYLRQGPLAPNPDLGPERGASADAAVVAQGRLGLASLGAFAAVYDDLIVYSAVAAGVQKPFNHDRAGVRGLEAEVATAPLGRAGLTAALAYTFLLAEALRGGPEVVGRDLAHRPRHRLFARVGIAPGPLDLHAEAHALGPQWLDARNLQEVPAALAFHAGGSIRLWRRPEVRIHLEVRNLADDRTLQNGFGYPLPGRMALVALRAASGADSSEGGDGR